MTEGQARILHLSTARLDLDTGDLVDAAGAPITLQDRSKAILAALITNADQDVAKEDLIAAVGGPASATDETLIECVGEIRKAIGDQAKIVLQTVPGVGFRLNTATSAEPRHKGQTLKFLGLAVALLPIILILFVLISGFLG